VNRQNLLHRRRPLAALIALLVGVLCLLPAAPALAEGETPVLEVLGVGWDGHVAQGYWSPIRVKVTGGASDVDGLVEVWLETQYQNGPTTTIRSPLASFGQEVSIPAHSSKELLVWVPAGFGQLGTIKLTAGGEELASQSIEFRVTKAPFWPLVGVLSDQDELATQVTRVELPLQGLPTAINVARVGTALIPTHPDYMKGVTGLVVQGNLASHLTDPQREAIYQWVQAGGHLVLAGGPDSALTAAVLPAEALPVTFGGAEREVDLTPLYQWAGLPAAGAKGPIARMQPQGGQILAGTPEQPLVWRTQVGKGMITVLAVDPTLEPLASVGQGMTALWKLALGPTVSDQYANDEYRYQKENEAYMAQRLRQVIEAMPPAAFPDWKELALWLGGFALLVGPVIHLALWRPKLRRWVWLAVPVASVLVAGTIYVTGVTVGGRDMIGHAVSHLKIDTDEGSATQSILVGVHAPMYPDLTVKLNGETPASGAGINDGMIWGPWGPQQVTEPPFRMIAGREDRVEYTGGETTVRSVMTSRDLGQEAGQVEAKLFLEGDQIKGTLTNKTPYHLEGITVLVARSWEKIGDLAPGESKEIALTPKGLEQQQQFYGYQPISVLMLGEPMKEQPGMKFPPDQPRPLELQRNPEIQRRARLIDSATQVVMSKMGYENATFPLMVLAFTTDPVGPALLDLGNHPTHHLTLIEQRLHLDLPAGPFRLPSALVPGDVTPTNVRGWGSGSDGKMAWIEFDNGAMTYTYTLPLTGKAEITSLKVTTQQIGKVVPAANRGIMNAPTGVADPAEDGVFQIYNWESGGWDWLPGGQTEVTLTDPTAYVSEDLQVKVQVWSGTERVVRFILPQLTVEGRMNP